MSCCSIPHRCAAKAGTLGLSLHHLTSGLTGKPTNSGDVPWSIADITIRSKMMAIILGKLENNLI
jgi:hypothetical protein